MNRLRHAAALLAVAALLGVAGCGEDDDSAAPAKSEGGKATSTPEKEQPAPNGY